jgi:predicted AlkP superfamily pyrophosphatase or phosphodiesterase
MKRIPAVIVLLSTCLSCATPTPKKTTTTKLVVGIVVDQMRYEYLDRFKHKFSKTGFNKLRNEGFVLENTHYNYVPTYTGPGHASIYTGTTPAVHGICANNWYSKKEQTMVNCVTDETHQLVGITSDLKVGPSQLMTATFSDLIKKNTDGTAKVISVAIKDRAAILPAGKLANAAFWLDGESGHWISSKQYMDTLPAWLLDFNQEDWVSQYLSQDWTTLLPITAYTESLADSNSYEVPFDKMAGAVFPYPLKALTEKYGKGLIKYTPFGNTLTVQLALEVLHSEDLGKGNVTDVLLLSLSSTDYIGHRFGPRSVELEDAYLRLDNDLSTFLTALDVAVGKENLLLFLTSDHGVMEVPAYLKDQQQEGGVYQLYQLTDSANLRLKDQFQVDHLVDAFVNDQLYLNERRIREFNINRLEVERSLLAWLHTLPFVDEAISSKDLVLFADTNDLWEKAYRGYYQGRSGDLLFVAKPGWVDQSLESGTTHGSGYTYDTHVPLIWYGGGIPVGGSQRKVVISDIAPTVTHLLGLPAGKDVTGKAIDELVLDAKAH